MMLNIASNQGVNMLNKTILIKDAIIGLGKDKDPLFGSIQYEQPAKPNTIAIIQTNNTTVRMPLSKIDLAVFKLDAETFGFIFQNRFLYDKKDFETWNKNTKRLASHELQPNF